MTVASNPRPASRGNWESGLAVNLGFMMRSEPVRRLTASERAARLASHGVRPRPAAPPRGGRAA